MSVPFEEIFNKLQYSSSVKTKQILRDLEGDPAELVQFCRQARRLSSVRASALAHMLAGLTNPEFLLLLKDYVLNKDKGLSEAAFSVLSKCNNSARKEMMFELLEAGDAQIRENACEVLGESLVGGSDNVIENNLHKLLGDESDEVIITALKVLSQSEKINVLRKAEDLLQHENSDIRFYALSVVANNEVRNFPVNKVAEILQNDSVDNNRIEACRLLAQKTPESGRPYFVNILREPGNSTAIRQQAVLAIAQIKNDEVAKILFNIICQDEHSIGVVMECRKALGKFEPEVIVNLCEGFFDTASVVEKFECVNILGGFSSEITQDFLLKELYKEHHQVVQAIILEHLSKLGEFSIWDFAEKAVYDKDNLILAYSAVQAMSELLIPDKVFAFAKILLHQPDIMIAEVVLKRIFVYGRDRGLAGEFSKAIQPYLQDKPDNLLFFALNVAGYIDDPALIIEMLRLVDVYVGTDMMDVLTDSIMHGVKGSLHRLLVLSGDGFLSQLTGVLSRLNRDSAVEDLSDFFGYLAMKAEVDVRGAQTCLTIGATLLSDDYIKSLYKVHDREKAFMLYTWSTLPEDMRVRTKIDWPMILSNSKVAVRVAALRAMTGSDIENHIADVSDIAFSDPKTEARESAIFILRELFTVH